MADIRATFEQWTGEVVAVRSVHDSQAFTGGVLEEVNAWGIVLRHIRRIATGPAEQTSYGGWTQPGEDREISEFFPWHMVSSIRILEPEEREPSEGS